MDAVACVKGIGWGKTMLIECHLTCLYIGNLKDDCDENIIQNC
jgi:hypothetical protein